MTSYWNNYPTIQNKLQAVCSYLEENVSLKVFLELVEFKAKTASVLPFFIGLSLRWTN